MIRTLIVDDEADARSYLRGLLADAHPEVEVSGEAANITEARRMIAELKPALVFLDVEMPGGSGFDLLREMKRWDFEVIFVTGFQRYAIQAIRFSALDYLPKPAQPDEMAFALERFQERHAAALDREKVQDQFLANIAQPQVETFRLTIPHGDRTFFVAPTEVERCMADRNYTWVHLVHDRRYLLARTLKEFEEMLTPFGFLRINRSALVRKDTILRLHDGHAELKDGEKLEVSRRRWPELKRMWAA
ncbi:MAG: response regulator transcription factor [Flavobacteriales bacterium]|nr:response regulator transcription factor [Flavobacteriales bacterium]